MKSIRLGLLLALFPLVLFAQNNARPDEHLTALIAAAREHKRDYVIESAHMVVKLETSAKYPSQTSAAEVQITYTLYALTNVTTFDEEYHSPVPNAVVERIPGSDPESKLKDTSPLNKAWDVLLNLKAGEHHTLTTKARYTYKLPFPKQRTIRDFRGLPPRDDVWGYPNTEDVIGTLTISIQSSIAPKPPHTGDALRVDESVTNHPKTTLATPTLQLPDKSSTKVYVLSHQWQDVMPGQTVELHLSR